MRRNPESDVVTWFEHAPIDAAKTVLAIVSNVVKRRAAEANGRPPRKAKVPSPSGGDQGSAS